MNSRTNQTKNRTKKKRTLIITEETTNIDETFFFFFFFFLPVFLSSSSIERISQTELWTSNIYNGVMNSTASQVKVKELRQTQTALPASSTCKYQDFWSPCKSYILCCCCSCPWIKKLFKKKKKKTQPQCLKYVKLYFRNKAKLNIPIGKKKKKKMVFVLFHYSLLRKKRNVLIMKWRNERRVQNSFLHHHLIVFNTHKKNTYFIVYTGWQLVILNRIFFVDWK